VSTSFAVSKILQQRRDATHVLHSVKPLKVRITFDLDKTAEFKGIFHHTVLHRAKCRPSNPERLSLPEYFMPRLLNDAGRCPRFFASVKVSGLWAITVFEALAEFP
jgi:hypothetical protein